MYVWIYPPTSCQDCSFPLAMFSSQPSESSFKTWTRISHSHVKFSHGFTYTKNKIQIPFHSLRRPVGLAPPPASLTSHFLMLSYFERISSSLPPLDLGIVFSALADISLYFHVSSFFFHITQNLLCEKQGCRAQAHWKDARFEGREVTGLERRGFHKAKLWVRWKSPHHHFYLQCHLHLSPILS